MIKYLIDNKVDAITHIKRLTTDVIKSTINNEPIFKVYNFTFSLKMTYQNLLKLLNDLLTCESMILIKKINIKSNYSNDDSLKEPVSIEMHLCLMEYEK